MAPRIGYTLEVIREIDPAACHDDPRLVWKSGDECNLGIVTIEHTSGKRMLTSIPGMNPRQMRSVARQLLKHAEALDRIEPHLETLIP